MSKMDTQGMSPELTPEQKEEWEKSGKKQVHKPWVVKPARLLTDMMVKELKILINEVLDEREYKKKLKGPYDLHEDLGPSYFDTDKFKYNTGEEEPPYQPWSD